MSHEYRMEQLRAAIAAARKNFKKDANFFVVGLTYGCRKSWKRILVMPALSFTCVIFFGNRIDSFIPAVKGSKWTPANLHLK